MTVSAHPFDRQESLTIDSTNSSKVDQNSFVNDSKSDEYIIPIQSFVDSKDEDTSSETDSGTDDIEEQQQQGNRVLFSTPINGDDDNEDQLSIKSSISHYDEGYSEKGNLSKLPNIMSDLELAERISDDVKKEICSDTTIAFHGEFARLISIPLSLRHCVRYYLFAKGEFEKSLFDVEYDYAMIENAKAHFKCSNRHCRHDWTSARARILFSISKPSVGFVQLEILGQNCKKCETFVNALWYIDEVCRVMKYLAQQMFNSYFPDMFGYVNLKDLKQGEENIGLSRSRRHNTNQRKGNMKTSHRPESCEACRRGLCFV